MADMPSTDDMIQEMQAVGFVLWDAWVNREGYYRVVMHKWDGGKVLRTERQDSWRSAIQALYESAGCVKDTKQPESGRRHDMNEKLRVAFWQLGNILVGRVLEQPESMRCAAGTAEKHLDTHGSYTLASCVAPAIEGARLYVRGTARGHDNEFFLKKYACEEEALAALAAFCALIACVNQAGSTPANATLEGMVESVRVVVAE